MPKNINQITETSGKGRKIILLCYDINLYELNRKTYLSIANEKQHEFQVGHTDIFTIRTWGQYMRLWVQEKLLGKKSGGKKAKLKQKLEDLLFEIND